LSKALDKPPGALGEFCSEGPAVSRTRLKIAWAADYQNYPDALPDGVSQAYTAEIDYSQGEPRLVNKTVVLDSRKVDFKLAEFETQNFVPPDESKLTFSAYGFQDTDPMMVDLATGEITNLTNSPGQYDEPEGVFPDGKYTLVESDRQHKGKGSLYIDLWKVPLDGSGEMQRITYFNEAGVYKATNPVVSDDGRLMAFQVPKVAEIAGVGKGIYVLDFEAAGLR
jgi:Tol biopolymer transport system component